MCYREPQYCILYWIIYQKPSFIHHCLGHIIMAEKNMQNTFKVDTKFIKIRLIMLKSVNFLIKAYNILTRYIRSFVNARYLSLRNFARKFDPNFKWGCVLLVRFSFEVCRRCGMGHKFSIVSIAIKGASFICAY